MRHPSSRQRKTSNRSKNSNNNNRNNGHLYRQSVSLKPIMRRLVPRNSVRQCEQNEEVVMIGLLLVAQARSTLTPIAV